MALFDPVFYRKAYSDLARCRQCNLRSHYALCGQMENRLPNIHTFKTLYPLFDLAVYRHYSPQLIFQSTEEYYAHFHHHGFDENRYFALANCLPLNKRRIMPRCPRHHVERRGATGPTGPMDPQGPEVTMDTAGIGDTWVTGDTTDIKDAMGKPAHRSNWVRSVRCYRAPGSNGSNGVWWNRFSGPPVQSGPRDVTHMEVLVLLVLLGQQETAIRALSGQLDPWVSQEIPVL